MKTNKKGASTLFLAIILSALILVQTTYIAYVADLDRRLTYTRALKEQTQIYLSSYDRLLFKTYGIYAFDSSRLDSSLFNSILEANGYAPGDVMYVSGVYSLDTETLKRAVAVFYSYRSSGVIVERFISQIVSALEQLDQSGVIGELRSFISSPASGMLGRIIDGGSEIASAISTAASSLGYDESSEEVVFFIRLFEDLGAVSNNSPDIANGFDPSDMSFIFDLLEFNAGMYEAGAVFEENVNLHGCLTNYAANNFDCMLEDDVSINGNDFGLFHDDNLSDSEYILTGLEGIAACALTDYYIYSALFIKNLVSNLTDPTVAELIVPAASILSAVITVISAGTVILPPEVYELIIVIIISIIESISELCTVLSGGQIAFLDLGSVEALTLDYRDFLSIFMNYVPDSLILQRMLEILNRDFPDHIIGINTEVDYRSTIISYEACYELYQ